LILIELAIVWSPKTVKTHRADGQGGKSQFLKCWLLHITLTSLSLFTPLINYSKSVNKGLLLMVHQHPFTIAS